MTFSPHIRRRCCPRVSPPVVPRKHLYVRKAGYSRYRVRRFFPPRLFPFCDKGIVGSECACRVFSTGECRVVPRVQRPDLPDPDVFLFSKRRKTNRFLPHYVRLHLPPPVPQKLYPAIAPNRRRIRPRSRPRSISCGLGRSNISAHPDLHKLYPSHPLYKSFAELFQKRPFPLVPPFPILNER